MPTINDANDLILLLQKNRISVELIGSFSKGKLESDHDIDIVINSPQIGRNIKDKLIELLNPSEVVFTDWNGIYLRKTTFGDVDVMFDKPPKSPYPCWFSFNKDRYETPVTVGVGSH